MNDNEQFSQISEFLAIFQFVFANSIEKAAHVTLFWNLSRNPDKISSKIYRKDAKFDAKNENRSEIHLFIREKMLKIFG